MPSYLVNSLQDRLAPAADAVVFDDKPAIRYTKRRRRGAKELFGSLESAKQKDEH